MRQVADVWVPGIPVTKGSVNVGRQGQVRQAARGYAAWSDAVRKTLIADQRRLEYSGLRYVVARPEGAMIRCRFWVPRPDGADAYGGLWAPGVGDGDKLDRAVWDAVTKAGLWQDDAQVIEWAGSRRWASDVRSPGVHIGIWAANAAEFAADFGPEDQSEAAYRRAMFGGAT